MAATVAARWRIMMIGGFRCPRICRTEIGIRGYREGFLGGRASSAVSFGAPKGQEKGIDDFEVHFADLDHGVCRGWRGG